MYRPTRNEIDWDTEKKKVRDAVRYNVLSFALLVAAIRIGKFIHIFLLLCDWGVYTETTTDINHFLFSTNATWQAFTAMIDSEKLLVAICFC